MKNQVSATLEKRARIMFEDSRRGAQNFIQWYSLSEDKRNEWRDQAIAIEASITQKLKEQTES